MESGSLLPRAAHRFDVKDATASARNLLRIFRPELHRQLEEEELIVKALTGGVTNKLLVAYFDTDKADKTLIRVYGLETDKMIDREAEITMLLTLHKQDCSGKLYGVFDNGLCYAFVEGEPLTVDTVRDEHINRLVVEKLVHLHSVHRVSKGIILEGMHLFDRMSSFLRLVPATYKDPEKQKQFLQYYPEPCKLFTREIETLKGHLQAPDISSPKVLCHNDLFFGNILYDKKRDCVKFIDYEYAGMNYQAYDLADYFNEFAGVDDCDFSRFPSRAFQVQWLRYYLECWNKAHGMDEKAVTDRQVDTLYVVVNKFSLASHLFWVLWTLVQAEHSDIEFDYLKYGKVRFDEYMKHKDRLLLTTIPIL